MVIFKICVNDNNRKSNKLASPSLSNILASRAARKFFFKRKLIYIKNLKVEHNLLTVGLTI